MDWNEHLEKAKLAFSRIEDELDAENPDWLRALRSHGRLADHLGNVVLYAAQQALDAGVTKKAMADALGVSPSTLTGLKKTTAKPKPREQYLDMASGEWRTR
jgi:hypothetical protein